MSESQDRRLVRHPSISSASASSSSSASSTTSPTHSTPTASTPAASAATSCRRLTKEDQRAIRRSGVVGSEVGSLATSLSKKRGRIVKEPRFLSVFRRHFPGRSSFFTELAIFRRHRSLALAELGSSAQKSLTRFIDALALARVSSFRPCSQCEFCSDPDVDAPFCALPPNLRPAGMKQHKLARSDKCLLQRALNGIVPSRDRIQSLFVDHTHRLRLVADTDAQGMGMIMLEDYVAKLWEACHRIGLLPVLRTIEIVLQVQGFASPTHDYLESSQALLQSESVRTAFSTLVTSVRSCSASSSSSPAAGDQGDRKLIERISRLHMAIFGADHADFAMHAIMLVLESKCSSFVAAVPQPPTDWLQEEADAVHASYPPERYMCDDGTVATVSRDHSQLQAWLGQWLSESSCHYAAQTSPAERPRNTDRSTSSQPDSDSVNDNTPESDDESNDYAPQSDNEEQRPSKRPRIEAQTTPDDDEEEEEDQYVQRFRAVFPRLHATFSKGSHGREEAAEEEEEEVGEDQNRLQSGIHTDVVADQMDAALFPQGHEPQLPLSAAFAAVSASPNVEEESLDDVLISTYDDGTVYFADDPPIDRSHLQQEEMVSSDRVDCQMDRYMDLEPVAAAQGGVEARDGNVEGETQGLVLFGDRERDRERDHSTSRYFSNRRNSLSVEERHHQALPQQHQQQQQSSLREGRPSSGLFAVESPRSTRRLRLPVHDFAPEHRRGTQGGSKQMQDSSTLATVPETSPKPGANTATDTTTNDSSDSGSGRGYGKKLRRLGYSCVGIVVSGTMLGWLVYTAFESGKHVGRQEYKSKLGHLGVSSLQSPGGGIGTDEGDGEMESWQWLWWWWWWFWLSKRWW